MKKYKQVTEEEFKQVKMLREAGFIPSQIRSIIKRSGNPVYDMIKSQTFDEYKQLTRERAQRRGKNTDNDLNISFVSTGDKIEAINEPDLPPKPEAEQQEILEVLRSIDYNLKYLVNNLPVREKRGMFR